MANRIAAVLSLVVFAACLVAGIEADNPLATTLGRALVGLVGTLVIGLVIGTMAQKMLDENLAARRKEAEAAIELAGHSEAVQEKKPAGGIPQTKSAMKGR